MCDSGLAHSSLRLRVNIPRTTAHNVAKISREGVRPQRNRSDYSSKQVDSRAILHGHILSSVGVKRYANSALPKERSSGDENRIGCLKPFPEGYGRVGLVASPRLPPSTNCVDRHLFDIPGGAKKLLIRGVRICVLRTSPYLFRTTGFACSAQFSPTCA